MQVHLYVNPLHANTRRCAVVRTQAVNGRPILLCMGLFSNFVFEPAVPATGSTQGRAIIPPVMGIGTPVVAG